MFATFLSTLRQQYLGALALFIVLGGTSYAAATGSIDSRQIKNNSIRSKDIRNNQVDSKDVRNRSLLSKDFKPGQLPAGPAGPRGDTGPSGPRGGTGARGPAGPATASPVHWEERLVGSPGGEGGVPTGVPPVFFSKSGLTAHGGCEDPNPRVLGVAFTTSVPNSALQISGTRPDDPNAPDGNTAFHFVDAEFNPGEKHSVPAQPPFVATIVYTRPGGPEVVMTVSAFLKGPGTRCVISGWALHPPG